MWAGTGRLDSSDGYGRRSFPCESGGEVEVAGSKDSRPGRFVSLVLKADDP
jgi:hypothetical protein